jgi:formylglycine-generating enzyme required for sulfatase activity
LQIDGQIAPSAFTAASSAFCNLQSAITMSDLTLFELIGQAVLPALADPVAAVPVERIAREVWSAWARERDAAGRAADVRALGEVSADAVGEVAGAVVRQLLPGKAGPAHESLMRYLTALPALVRRAPAAKMEHADEMLAWVPARVPQFRAGDRPEGVGDRELVELVRLTSDVEAWLARNPHMPELPPVLLVFFTGGGEPAAAALAWHRRAAGPATLRVQHSYLHAPVPCVQFAGPGQPVKSATAQLFRQVVEAVARLHRLDPPLTAGALTSADLSLAADGAPVLAILTAPAGEPRDDVRALGMLGRRWLAPGDGGLADLLSECQADDPLRRPADAAALLARLDGVLAEAPPATTPQKTAPTPRRRGAEVWKVLDTLQKAEPELPKLITNGIGMKFVLVPAGTFRMGSPPDEVGRRDNEGPAHEVILTRPFYLGVYPVTQAEYQAVTGRNPARFQGASGGGPLHPIENVSWDEAVAFCARLGERGEEKAGGRSYRLPTEAEWEFACRAGTTTPFHTGAGLDSSQSSFDGNHPYGGAARGPAVPRTARVGSFAPNHFGLYDMHGNVWEWCADWFDAGYYAASPRQDPPGPAEGTFRVLRGGSWRNQAVTCRSAYRNALAPNQRQPFIGFRIVLVWRP